MPDQEHKSVCLSYAKFPAEWGLRQLSEFAATYRYPTFYDINYQSDGVPVLNIGNINNETWKLSQNLDNYQKIDSNTSTRFAKTIVEEGDLVLAVRGATIGKFALGPASLSGSNINANLLKVHLNKDVCNPIYFWYFTQSEHGKAEFRKFVSYTAKETVQASKLRYWKVILPKKNEQQKLASILSNVDELIQKTDQIIEQTQRLKKGLMQKLLIPRKQEGELRNTTLNQLFDHWIKVTLGSIITLQRGHDLPDHQRCPGNIPVVGANGITGYHNVAKEKGPGVLMGRSGTLGKLYFIDSDYWPLNTSLYVKKFNTCDPKFVYYFLQTIDYDKYNAGSTVPTMNRNLLHPVIITIPEDIEIQRRIATILSTVDELIQKEKERREYVTKLKKGMMRNLLTGKIRVKV